MSVQDSIPVADQLQSDTTATDATAATKSIAALDANESKPWIAHQTTSEDGELTDDQNVPAETRLETYLDQNDTGTGQGPDGLGGNSSLNVHSSYNDDDDDDDKTSAPTPTVATSGRSEVQKRKRTKRCRPKPKGASNDLPEQTRRRHVTRLPQIRPKKTSVKAPKPKSKRKGIKRQQSQDTQSSHTAPNDHQVQARINSSKISAVESQVASASPAPNSALKKSTDPSAPAFDASLSKDPVANAQILKPNAWIWIACPYTNDKLRPAYVLHMSRGGAYVLLSATFGGKGPRNEDEKSTRIVMIQSESHPLTHRTERPLFVVRTSKYKVKNFKAASLDLELHHVKATDGMQLMEGDIDLTGQLVLNQLAMTKRLNTELAANWDKLDRKAHFDSIQMRSVDKDEIEKAFELNADAIRIARLQMFESDAHEGSFNPQTWIRLAPPPPPPKPVNTTPPAVPSFLDRLLKTTSSAVSSTASTVSNFHGSVVPTESVKYLHDPKPMFQCSNGGLRGSRSSEIHEEMDGDDGLNGVEALSTKRERENDETISNKRPRLSG